MRRSQIKTASTTRSLSPLNPSAASDHAHVLSIKYNIEVTPWYVVEELVGQRLEAAGCHIHAACRAYSLEE